MTSGFPVDRPASTPRRGRSEPDRPAVGRMPASVAPIERLITALDVVAGAPTILDGIRVGSSVRDATRATRSAPPATHRDLVAILVPAIHDASDGVTAIAATHALAGLADGAAVEAIGGLLEDAGGPLAPHAAWALVDRPPIVRLIPALVRLVETGGLGGLHAQAALERWAADEPAVAIEAIVAGFLTAGSSAGRRRLAETLGLVPGGAATARLTMIAADRDAEDEVRSAAVAALGDRWTEPLPAIIATFARGDGPFADTARLAALDHEVRGRPLRVGRSVAAGRSVGRPLRIAQVHLGGSMDPQLRRSGAGDTGGIATLLVTLGDALLRTPVVGGVTTIGRGSADDALAMAVRPIDGHGFMPVPLHAGEGSAFTSAWPARIAAARGIRRAFLAHGRPDVIHLRMADAGTLAAAEVAAEFGIPTVFTLAPDPHARIAALEAAGGLSRASFAAEDAGQHLWYRVHLVDRLSRSADEVALFPREGLADRLRAFVGFDVEREAHRATVVPEGIDIARVVAADAAARSGEPIPAGSALADLRDRISGLPAVRQGLPLVVSAGRLQELKGMARLVAAFVDDPTLRARATLVIVGGDLADPAPEERAELDRIQGTLDRHPDAADAVILLGHRPNGEVAHLLAAARRGLDDGIGANGAYACASHKEEFGLAIVEALAAGLPVVAPIEGGPSTYVEDGRTGVLVDTGSTAAIGAGVHRALDLAGRPGRAEHATAMVRARYDIATMASSLASIYRRAAAPRAEQLAS